MQATRKLGAFFVSLDPQRVEASLVGDGEDHAFAAKGIDDDSSGAGVASDDVDGGAGRIQANAAGPGDRASVNDDVSDDVGKPWVERGAAIDEQV